MDIKTLKNTLPLLLKNNIVPFIWGRQGVGKTQSVAQLAKEQGVGFVHLHLATQEVGDLVGLLMHCGEGEVKHARPEWFPTEGNGIIFLDELNRAHPDVIQAMFSFITSRTIHRHVLPPGWKIVAAGNYQSEEFTVTDTSDAAWMSRFCHLHFTPSKGEFVTYAETKGCTSVADFVSENGEMLEGKKNKDTDIPITPDRRSWLEMVGPMENEDLDDETRFEIYSGIVGVSAASSFMAFRKSTERKIRIRDIIKDYSKVRSKVVGLNGKDETRFDALSAPIEELIVQLNNSPYFLNEKSVKELQKFFLDLPLELIAQTSKKLNKISFNHKADLIDNPEFVDMVCKKRKVK